LIISILDIVNGVGLSIWSYSNLDAFALFG